MIYLSLTIKIPDDILKKLSDVGLIRVFFGVENVSKEFIKHNHKYISSDDTKSFISKMNKYNISYHIGFILFSVYSKYDDLRENIDFLHKLKKLYRLGVLVEKMRILPNSKDSDLLFYDDSKIDQAYNYHIIDSKAERYYIILNDFFSNIDVRKFEQFFTGVNIARVILIKENKFNDYDNLFVEYDDILDNVNDEMYKLLIKLFNNLEFDNHDISILLDLYSKAESNYLKFMNLLYKKNNDVLRCLPHGQEELNVW